MANQEVADQELTRELGFWDALTIGAGTMIGAGIFLLAGVALELTGPAAIFSYLAAGLVCIATAASAAELATGMPTSGGDYFFVSRSLGPAFGAISGVGIWLSLTFAISFYLYGLGEYLSQFLPLTPFWGALLGGVLLTALNVIGAKESGRTQVVVVLTLMAILGGFSVVGVFNIEMANFTPFFPRGVEPIFSTTALVFVSFLGFVKIAAVAEEIKEPSKNLPRALIGSVALVTVLYVVILLVIGGIFPQATIRDVPDPLVSAARLIFGPIGAGAIIFAGLLATLSSANASIMAASRINLAMARDRMVPNWLSLIHEKLLTPYRAIIVTGILALLFLFIESLEQLAKIASTLQLYSYAALNIGCVLLRAAGPDWYRPTYRTPGYPYVQVLAALACLAIIIFSGPFAMLAVGLLIVSSLAWYFTWGRGRVEITHAVPDLKARWQENGFRAITSPPAYAVEEVEAVEIKPRAIDPSDARRVMVALANPAHEKGLLRLARYVATGREAGGDVYGLHLVTVPIQTPLREARGRFEQRPSIEQTIAELADEAGRETDAEVDAAEQAAEQAPAGDAPRPDRPLEKTRFHSITDVAHDVFAGLIAETRQHRADMVLLGWQGGFNVGRIYNSSVQRVLRDAPADVAVLKNRGLEEIRSILVPWGGGMHARLGLEVATRIGRAAGATIHVVRVVKPGVDVEQEKEGLQEDVEEISEGYEGMHYHIEQDESVTDGLAPYLDSDDYDLLIIGASQEWTFRNVLFGSIPDVVADRARCSVLMMRHYYPETLVTKATEGIKRMREKAGLTTSPD